MNHQSSGRNAEDLRLARRIVAGSEEAWHDFILRYSGLIYSVVRRYVFDDDDMRTVYVDVLERLYRGTLKTFEGRSALSTWLVLVSRTTALDFLRKRFGRREIPRALKRLSARDQEIFRRYYVEGMSFSALRHWSAQQGHPLSPQDLALTLKRIEEGVDRRMLRRMKDLANQFGFAANLLPDQREEFEEARALLEWLSEDHFVFLGMHEFGPTGKPDGGPSVWDCAGGGKRFLYPRVTCFLSRSTSTVRDGGRSAASPATTVRSRR